MSVSREHRDYCINCLSARGDFTPVYVQRFLDYAEKHSANCRFCGGNIIYSCPMKKIISNSLEQILAGILGGNKNIFYWCPNCNSSTCG